MHLRIFRYDPDQDAKPYMKDYDVQLERSDRMLLDALVKVKAQDDSVAFRRSCREGVCGSDAININGKNGLACITKLVEVREPVEVRPLPGLPVIRDLIVDMTQFFDQYHSVKPYVINHDPEPERERLQSLAEGLSEEDLLRGFDVLTRTETELRGSADPRISLELALLKLVHMRRLMPFAELVARVERLVASGPAAALPGARARAPLLFDDAPAPAPRAAAPSPAATPAASSLPPPTPEPADPASVLLRGMLELSQARPSLAQPLRGARARLEDQTLVLDVGPDFATFASLHADEYRDLARRAAGKAVAVRFDSGAPAEAEAEPSPEELRRRRLREEAEREPAVQEALDLFGGRVVDVREAKPSREDP